jgi:hypothetical protein
MLLAMIAAVGPGANRAIVLLTGHPAGNFHVWLISGLVLLGLINDWRTRGRPHSATPTMPAGQSTCRTGTVRESSSARRTRTCWRATLGIGRNQSETWWRRMDNG